MVKPRVSNLPDWSGMGRGRDVKKETKSRMQGVCCSTVAILEKLYLLKYPTRGVPSANKDLLLSSTGSFVP
eukprot:9476436-Alexandrium_andersonii.AAC.1